MTDRIRAALRQVRPLLIGLPGAGIFAAGAALADGATPPPDSTVLAALRAELSLAKAVRVTAATGPQVLRDVRVDSFGIWSARWGPGAASRPALIVTQEAAPPPRPQPIAWSDIARIETGTTSTRSFALKGLLLGGLFGAAFWWTFPTGEDGGRGPAVAVIGVPATVGLLFGALLGSRQYHWSTSYPRQGRAGSPP